jgi:hypothetical protein
MLRLLITAIILALFSQPAQAKNTYPPAQSGMSAAHDKYDTDAPADPAVNTPAAKEKHGRLYELEKYLKDYTKTYFLYIDKKINKLYLIDRNLKVWRRYAVSIGMKQGDKLYDDDYRTPAGVYHIKYVCQYEEPWYLPVFREKARILPDGTETKNMYARYLKQLEAAYKKHRQKLIDMNAVYLRARDGHVRYGTGESLGYNAYGPVFLMLDYPNEMDFQRYEDAIDDGLIPRTKRMYFKRPGEGIAIHGTNDNASLGFPASAGCVRMRNDQIKELSNYVMEGTMVIID